ncbi:Rrf2 family transcriptional regulator [Proteiniclasticum sp. QWL-01]|uniref:RrF2 family transcriptional regulator n=1 Tax=Proteiniclasticum sp. QWL-01 TaxID=3036945 RepID=UPI0021FB9A41|nr:Rrf2 family transcriptional regulator [Proteiniclasticum sp. QWL-01]UUM12934.1 Rrf2 family transcriptional regulator [Clostridiaceae bacterium HFYG-1003]WFF74480.1 Rrf2 family transcriptional regulator [Proteiniclasticum sp. QWL-01]
MKLSTKGRYGVKAMVDLAIHQGTEPVSIKSISQRQNISEYYLEQLFAPLRRAEIIKSIRGAQGGYELNKPARDITVLDIMNILEGPIEVSDCLDSDACSNIDCCATRTVWKKLKDSIDSVMGAITLQDIVNDYHKNNDSINFMTTGKGDN